MGGGKEMRQVSKDEEEHITNETEHEELTMPTIRVTKQYLFHWVRLVTAEPLLIRCHGNDNCLEYVLQVRSILHTKQELTLLHTTHTHTHTECCMHTQAHDLPYMFV